ncbi:hypothetical protein [Ktedonospora formicarum]|uniref:Nitroreductase family deazaflavin-dependent oxidoreductase n=1 Tax=Ktedonospora formicarum TaxID=2778364 RepID=A0A8J3MT58_9CHLR|nr:hypothetical protein [Ktedonospora formicarum]GHO47862.1 hypothetical protein KSX_60250 [Ktedonospora formicarum]
MSESNVQVSRKGLPRRRPPWNSYVLAHPLVRRVMRFAVLKHTGRRSGRVFATPVSGRPTANGFVVPLTFGEKTDWYRNALATNGCVIQWEGVEYRLIDPQIISPKVALPAFNLAERILLPMLGIKQYIQFRHAPAGGEDTASPKEASSQSQVK